MMARGGARNRSGPPADPTSGRSDARGYKLDALPAGGYDGEVPEYPLRKITYFYEVAEDGETRRVEDADATETIRRRELELWDWAWTTPQACAWSAEPWRWQAVAMWVRNYITCENADAKAADRNSLHRFADQIGLTPAGLKENGWAIAKGEPAPASEPGAPLPSNVTDIKSRLASGGA